ncbi:hypothetical protein [Streptodolium elevatio]
MSEPKLAVLSQMWDEFRAMAFPPGFVGWDPAGECMAFTDSMVAGCVHTALSRDGSLDDWRRGVLDDRIAALGKALPVIAEDEYATTYFTHMRKVAELAAEISADGA